MRRGRNGVTVLPAEGFVGALYVHEMARSGDPHLHAHLVIANRVRGPDGRWSAPDMRPVYAHAKTAGTIADAVMRARALAQRSASSGGRWSTASPSWSPYRPRCASTSPPATPRSWRRPSRVGSPPAPASPPSSARRATERASSRASEAVAEWRARAAEHGFGERELRRALGRVRGVTASDYNERLRAQAKRMLGPEGLTRQSSTFTRREVIQRARRRPPRGRAARPPRAPRRRLPRARLRRAHARRATTPSRGHREALYTTPDMLRAEVRLLEAATGRDPDGPVVADARAARRRDRRAPDARRRPGRRRCATSARARRACA